MDLKRGAKITIVLFSALSITVFILCLPVFTGVAESVPASSSPDAQTPSTDTEQDNQPAQISEFRVSQIFQHLPAITVYMHLQDDAGRGVENTNGAEFSAFMDTSSVQVSSIARFDAGNDGVAYLFLVDISRSITAAQFTNIKNALTGWVDKLNEKDRCAVMTFGTAVHLVQDFSDDRTLLKNSINRLSTTDMDTQLHLGLAKAMELCRRKDQDLPGRRVIITLSDGRDDFTGGMTKNEVLNRMKEDPVPVYAIGFVKPPINTEKELYLKSLGEFARTSGGLYFNAANTPLGRIYEKVRQSIIDVWSARLDCSQCRADGAVHRLQMSLKSGSRTITDGQNIRLLPAVPADETQPVTPQPQPTQPQTTPSDSTQAESAQPTSSQTPAPQTKWWQKIPSYGWAAGAVLLVLIIYGISAGKRRATPETKPDPDESMEPGYKMGNDDVNSGGTADAVFSVSDSVPSARSVPESDSKPPRNIRLVTVGIQKSRSYTADIVNTLVIGRSKSCDMVISDDDLISGRHCRLIQRKGGIYLEDTGSTNGTMVNGVPFSGMYLLNSSDLILIGRTELRILF